MGIILKQIRIQNFRSLENIDLTLNMTSVLIGQNNVGKSNFLKAVDIALGNNRNITKEDIYIKQKERLSSDKKAIIDILIKPIDGKSDIVQTFSAFWRDTFTTEWIMTDATEGDFVAIRTIIAFDKQKNEYTIIRKPLRQWNSSIEHAVEGTQKNFNSTMNQYINSFFMDAHRDVSEDIRNKKSYFGKTTSQSDLDEKVVLKLEKKLDAVNKEILNNIPTLQHTSQRLESVCKTLGNSEGEIAIEPLSRKITDLHKGMDVTFRDGKAAAFSISQHGMGTRSWVSFLTLGSYVDWYIEQLKIEDDEAENYVMLTMEEPEAHLHSQAQKQIYSQIVKFNGQKIISTHSASVVAQAELENIIHFTKKDGVTNINRFDKEIYDQEALNKIKREVINTRGELLFSKAVVLVEGITEEQALPIYFNEYFGVDPIFLGINIIGIGGQNYKTFLNLIKAFDIPWFIFSDGEQNTIKTVRNAVNVVSQNSLNNIKNIVILENNEDYEKHLIASKYGDIIVNAINECEQNENYFMEFMKKNNHKSDGRYKTDKPKCKTCNQNIFEDKIKNYDNEDGFYRAVYDCCTSKNAKAKYASFVAQKIIEQDDITKKIPPKVKQLFDVMAKNLNLEIGREFVES